MKKGIVKGLAFVLLAALMLALGACGSRGSTNDTKQEQQVGEKKVELSKAMENYDKKTVKRIDATADATFSFYLQSTRQNATVPDKKDIQAKIGVTRIVDDGKYYDKAELIPGGKADDSVIAMFNTVKDQGGALVPSAVKYVDYVIDFLENKITAYAEMGMVEGTCNLKAQYKNTGSDERTEDVWCVFDAQSAADLAGIDVQADVFAKAFLSDSLLGKIDLTNAEDSGPRRVNAEGVASYDMKLDVNRFTNNVAEIILDNLADMGVKLESEKEKAIEKALKTIKTWITVSPTTLKSTVNKDQLPQNMKLTTTVNIDIKYETFREMMNELSSSGLVDTTKKNNINRILWLLTGYTRSSKNEEGYIGLAFEMNLEEKFSYEEAKCDTTKQDKDLYVSEDVEVEGRINLVNEFKEVLENDVNTLIEKALDKYEVEKAQVENLVAEIVEELDFSEKVTISMVLSATAKVCARHELQLKASAEVEAQTGEEGSEE